MVRFIFFFLLSIAATTNLFLPASRFGSPKPTKFVQHLSSVVDVSYPARFLQYAHRMLGRALGVIYGVPLLYFGLRGRIPAHIRGRVAGLFALGGAQGLVGWWMVKSGLEVWIHKCR